MPSHNSSTLFLKLSESFVRADKKRKKKYYSMIQRVGESAIWIGNFETIGEASNAYNKKVKELYIYK